MEKGEFDDVETRNKFNSASILKKHLTQHEVSEIMESIDCHWLEGRSGIAPELVGYVCGCPVQDIVLFKYGITC